METVRFWNVRMILKEGNVPMPSLSIGRRPCSVNSFVSTSFSSMLPQPLDRRDIHHCRYRHCLTQVTRPLKN